MTPAGGAFGAGGVVDAGGAVAPHVVIEPEGVTAPAGETDGRDVPDCETGEPSADANPAAGEPTTGPTANPAPKPAAATAKTTTKVTKTTVAKASGPKTAAVASTSLPKTVDNNCVVASMVLFLLGTVFLAVAYRC